MALIHFDGFGVYPNNFPLPLAASAGIASILATSANDVAIENFGRYDSRSLKINRSNYWADLKLASPKKTIVVGDAIYIAKAGTPAYSAAEGMTIWLKDADGAGHLSLNIVGTEIRVYRGTTLLGETVGAAITPLAWYYVEVKATIDNTVGTVEVRVNEVSKLALTGVDTQNTANDSVGVVALGSVYHDLYTNHDDLYILDTTGSQCNDFLGDVRVDTIRPDGAGTHTDFTPSAGANYQNVDDSPSSDGATTYNESVDVGDKDSYALSALPSPPAGAAIYGTKTSAVMWKTDVGAKSAKILTISGATEHASAEIALSDSPLIYSEILELNPADSAAYEDADINSLEAGVEDFA
jgi:hypothetical protein